MSIGFPYTVDISFPGDLEYIPAVRKFVSEMLQVSSFSPKFAYRSEIIVDEICNNAVNYGCLTEDAVVELTCRVTEDHIEFMIKDQGGTPENIRRLRTAMQQQPGSHEVKKGGLGLEIVRMLSEKVDMSIEESNLTSIHVVRKREATAGSDS